jgi:hypothetical protein
MRIVVLRTGASVTTNKTRPAGLTTTELYHLDAACRLIFEAFGDPPYLVGSAGHGSTGSFRDVDVRLMLDAEQFALVCPTRARWELLCLTIGAYLRERSGLPIDFQIQQTDIANERFSHPRNPLGLGAGRGQRRVFAGGGDGTPGWEPA